MSVNTSIKEVSYTLESMSIHGLACGSDDRKNNIVLCLHGWLDNAASFLPLMPQLQQNLSTKHIIAIDWPGHGNSSHKSMDAHYHFVDWIYDLLQLFELNDWQQVDIVAHSMGGMIASAFTAAFPEKVKSLTLIDSIGLISKEAEQTTKQLREGMLSRFKSSQLKKQKNSVKKKNYHSSLDSAVKARVNVSDLHYDHAKLIVERGTIEVEKGFRWRSDVRLTNLSPYRLTLKQAQQLIRDIKCPVQLIYGSNGLDLVTSGLKEFEMLFEHFSRIELDGGHHVHMEKIEQTAKLVQQFITK